MGMYDDYVLDKLSEARALIWKELEEDLNVDEDHLWRAKRHMELATIELAIAEFDIKADLVRASRGKL